VSKTIAVLGSVLFLLAAPLTLAGLVPWWMTRWAIQPPLFGQEVVRAIGLIMILAGAVALLDSFARFALQGRGTPAPVAPPRRLVVSGLYRYVRNPMYVAVAAVILGQGLLFGDWRLLVYGAAFWLACHLFVLAYEEPTLKRMFGAEYEVFLSNVPRWIPRLTPWRKR
jgi:protein-S-isoprenylcysteine O-methyltransferase Ste14